MRFVIVIKCWYDFLEIGEDFIVSGHVRSQNAADHAFSHLLEVLHTERSENVAIVVLQQAECHAAVVVLQRGNVVIADRKFRFCIYLVDIVVAGVVQVVADA